MAHAALGPTDREPELLTHHEHNGSKPDDFNTGEQSQFDEFGREDAEGPGGSDGKTKPVLTPKQRKRRRWRRIRRTLYVLVGLFFVLPSIIFTIMYLVVEVPTPESVAARQNQPISYFFGDGSPMGRELPAGGGGNRVPLKVGELPPEILRAIYAAEDATFESNSGFDVGGILRAVYNQLTGGSGGGSTISQQYIKKATENEAPTLTRKATELVKSFKMNNQQSKPEIITAYLNIIYFGRGASGIQAAAQAYYKKDAKDLSVSEAALLAGMIQGPSKYKNLDYVTKRWNYVMDQLVKNNWMAQEDRDAATFPTPVPLDETKQSADTPNFFIQQRVKAELEAQGFAEDQLFTGGYKIYTTIDSKAQQAAEQAVAEGMKGQTDPQILNALVAVDPKTGGVKAYYGGPTVVKDESGKEQLGQDRANQARNPGSSIKPFDLTAFLKLGKGLGEIFDGTSPRKFPGVTKPIRNAGPGSSCSAECTVAEAMKISANTVFYDMVLNVVRPNLVAVAAIEAGIRTRPNGKASLGQDNNIALGGGDTEITPEDMAAGFATFASDGTRREQHFLTKLTNSSDETAYEFQDKNTPAFNSDAEKSKQIAGNVTEALKPVISFSKLKCPTGHECAGKTGTQQYDLQPGDKASLANANAQTWMVGYTPSVSAAVWVGGDGNKALRTKDGGEVFGSTLAGPIWQKFLQLYLAGQPPEKFPTVKPIGKEAGSAPPPASVTPSPTPSSESSVPSETTAPETSDQTESTRPRRTRSVPPIFDDPPARENRNDEPSRGVGRRPNYSPVLPGGYHPARARTDRHSGTDTGARAGPAGNPKLD